MNQVPRSLRWIAEYEALEAIGAGGMGIVLKCRHRQTRSVVAIKVLSVEATSDPVVLKRFRQEFRVLRAIEHPHIVRTLDFGLIDGRPYFAMEHVDGPSLETFIEEKGPMPEADATAIILQIARGLQEAHRHNLIHRDIKPGNILLGNDGCAKLIDFGLAKDLGAELLTKPFTGLGTPDFAAPEQFGDARHVDARTDVYSLAATLYMAVTGDVPFAGRGTLSTLQRKLGNNLVPPRSLAPHISTELDLLLRMSLQADPVHRPESCGAFIKQLANHSARSDAAVSRFPAFQKGFRRVSMQERRADVRFRADLDAECRCIDFHDSNSWAARIVDVSAAGVALVVVRRFEVGTILELQVEHRHTEDRFYVRVQRIGEPSSNRWLHGCVFSRRLSELEIQRFRGTLLDLKTVY